MAMFGKGHSHSHHAHEDIEVSQIAPTPSSPKSVKEGHSSLETKIEDSHVAVPVSDQVLNDDPVTITNEEEIINIEKPEPRWSVIGGILVGDCFHNFVDGLAVGVAWTLGWGAGLGNIARIEMENLKNQFLGTTLAIVMHELPHELGDFIVYKKLGLKTRQALALNFIAALVRKGFQTHSVLKMSRQWSSDFRGL